MFVTRKKCLAIVLFASVGAATVSPSMADERGFRDFLSIDSIQHPPSWAFAMQDSERPESSDGVSRGLVTGLGDRTTRTGDTGAHIQLSGPLGMVLDYASGLPRFGGVALSPADNVRLEASAGVKKKKNGVGGLFTIHFDF